MRPAPLAPQESATCQVQHYLNGIRTLQSRFQQFAQDGGIACGTIYLQRPGKMRIVYDPPTPILIVSDGDAVYYWDSKLEQLSQIGVEDTPGLVPAAARDQAQRRRHRHRLPPRSAACCASP